MPRNIRIYHSGDLTTGLTVMLEPNASHHLLQVLRKSVGECFWLFNGQHGEFEARLVSTGNKLACVEVGAFHVRETESSLYIHLGQSISRGERMDYAIQKSVELGVSEITPLFTDFCQVQLSSHRVAKRVAHWQAIAISAAEQSGRVAVPKVHTPIAFSAWAVQNCALKIVCCPSSSDNAVLTNMQAEQHLMVAVGAEGGFSDRELALAMSTQFQKLSLGPRILRTETAAVVAMTLLQAPFLCKKLG